LIISCPPRNAARPFNQLKRREFITVSAPLASDTIATVANASTVERSAIRIGIFTSRQP
jgi:hypothetical protein